MVMLLCRWVFTTTIQAIKRSDEDYVLTNVLLLTLSGKNIKKWALQNMQTFHACGVMLRNMNINQRKI